MSVPLLDLKAQFSAIEVDIRSAIDRVLATQHFILGPEVEACEREIADYCRVGHAVGVSSGTDALLVALMALGVGPGDEVVTTSYSFFATAGVVARLGARPVFVDIDPATFNIDPQAIEQVLTDRTRAIIPVHLYGRCAAMDKIGEIAAARGIPVIEDAAQAIGASIGGRMAGSFGAMGCFSFFPSKNLGAFGDGGMVVTDDSDLAERLRILRVHGASPKYYHAMVGGNFRLDALQAAVVRVKLPHLDAWSAGRRANARRYADRLSDIQGLICPDITPGHVVNQYVVRIPGRRDAVAAHLRQARIGVEIYYPRPLHLQECFSALGYRPGTFPHAELAAAETLALPIYPELTPDQIDEVATAIQEALAA
ncbi:MAG: DegT/DnrJ/EryC1/StrS family aminotransferase [Alphaproteobacteria bacterium]|nr:DegT/DnrJ/EryC1/StrS family aminotransferase [Alphaproteobacteria bacterium]